MQRYVSLSLFWFLYFGGLGIFFPCYSLYLRENAGLYRFLRNPITLGLVLIYIGFVLALPSVGVLVGFILFFLNSTYRIRMEEVYLESAFGDDYRQYKRQVGKYFPRVSKRLQ